MTFNHRVAGSSPAGGTYKIGFTGTRRGMNEYQKIALFEVTEQLTNTSEYSEFEFHHGQCVGADEEAALIVGEFATVRLISHPPNNMKYMATISNDEDRPPKPYLVRNRDIVEESDILIVCPGEMKEQLRSGTWSTYRYARKVGKLIALILPLEFK